VPGPRQPARGGARAAVSQGVRARGARHVGGDGGASPLPRESRPLPLGGRWGDGRRAGRGRPADQSGVPETVRQVRAGEQHREDPSGPLWSPTADRQPSTSPGLAAFSALSTTGATPGEAATPSNGRRRASGSAAPWARAGVGAGPTAPVPPRNSTSYWVRSCEGTPSMTACGATAHASPWCTMRQRARGGTGCTAVEAGR